MEVVGKRNSVAAGPLADTLLTVTHIYKKECFSSYSQKGVKSLSNFVVFVVEKQIR